MGGVRGRLTDAAHRQDVLALVDEAIGTGCRQAQACAALAVSLRTVQRWRREGLHDQRSGTRAAPGNQLGARERQRILTVLNTAQFRDKSPNQVVPMLAERGEYLASESTMYRILKQHNQLAHRQRSAPPTRREPVLRAANAPGQLWSWDISYLRSPVRGLYYYLYLVVDLYSRKIVGFAVHDRECSELAAQLVTEACHLEGISPDELTLHADNGAPMKGATLLATLQTLGVIPSFSRPSVSDDNPFSEALFRTVKYCPHYPQDGFATLGAARAWVEQFVTWYNTEHRHSALKFVTPEQRHRGDDQALLAQRHDTYQAARDRHPERWSGKTRDWTPVASVKLNTFPSRSLQISAQALEQQAA